MRKRIITGAVLIISGALLLALLNLNFLVNHRKTYLLAQAEQSLGHKISADRIEVNIWSLSARLINAVVFDDPDLSIGNSLRAKAIQFDLQFLPLLVGRFRARKIAVDSPVISLVRDDSSATEPRAVKRNRAANNQDRLTEKQNRPLFVVAPLNISDGTLRYRDPDRGGELTVTQIKFILNNFESDEGPFDVEFEAAVMAAKPNVKLKGKFGPVAGVLDYRDIPMDGVLQVNDLDMSKVNRALPRLKKALPKVLQFDGIYSTKELKFKGSLNKPSLQGTVSGTDTSLRFE